ncbi:MAG: hypothetical protein ACR2P1_20325, partial [Pseudomonadales bacterium]
AKQAQAGALVAFSTDFEVWKHKLPAIKVMQTKSDGQFNTQRKWVGQFYMSERDAQAVKDEINGIVSINDFPQPTTESRDAGFEDDCFQFFEAP